MKYFNLTLILLTWRI